MLRFSSYTFFLGALFVLTLLNTFIGSTNGYKFHFVEPNFTFHYDSTGYLHTPLTYDFCAPVPNVPAMKIIQPKDFVNGSGQVVDSPPCDAHKFGGAVLLSVLGSFIFVLFIFIACVCVCPCVCFTRYRLGFFGGDKTTPISGINGLILPGDETAGVKQRYTLREVNAVKISYLVIFGSILVGCVIVIASTQMISGFIHETDNIFVSYTDFTVGTVRYITQNITNTKPDQTTLDLLNSAYKNATDFEDSRKDNISSGLHALSYFVQAMMYITVILVVFVLLLGVAAGWLHIPRLAIFLALVLVVLLGLVWIDYTVAYAANNILNKMCDTINNCHFCIEGQLEGVTDCTACRQAWFQSMRRCTDEDSNRVLGLKNYVNNTKPIGHEDFLLQLRALDCNDDDAYIESTPGPGLGIHGTYDRLQEQLCPAMSNPQYSVFQMVQLLALGLTIIGLCIPCAQIALCLGDKRWKRTATTALLLTNEYEAGYTEINDRIETKPGTTAFFGSN